MKADRPSRTAHFVAFGRALADARLSHVPDFRDPTARAFVTEKGKESLAKIEAAVRGGQRSKRLDMARVMADLIGLRTAAIDSASRSTATGIHSTDVLDRAGHDRSSPTCWIWEGVVMYLTRDAMRATLRGIAGRSASGSTLIVNYHTAHRRFIARLIFRLIGEPQISMWTPDEMAADLRSVGFTVREDSNMADWNNRFAESKAKIERAFYMRIAVARN